MRKYSWWFPLNPQELGSEKNGSALQWTTYSRGCHFSLTCYILFNVTDDGTFAQREYDRFNVVQVIQANCWWETEKQKLLGTWNGALKFINYFIHEFSEYLLKTYSVPGTGARTGWGDRGKENRCGPSNSLTHIELLIFKTFPDPLAFPQWSFYVVCGLNSGWMTHTWSDDQEITELAFGPSFT